MTIHKFSLAAAVAAEEDAAHQVINMYISTLPENMKLQYVYYRSVSSEQTERGVPKKKLFKS